jgi:hypothetical protein
MMRKAQMSAIVVLILVVIIALALFGFGQKIFYKLFGEGTIETCRLSVLAQTKTELAGASVLTLECERRYIDIFPTKVQFGNQPDNLKTISVYENGVKKKSFKNATNDIVNGVVAQEMKTCWYEFGEAKTEIFPNNEPITETFGTADDDICFTCSEIQFEDIKNQQFTGLIDYMKNNDVPDTKYTYWEYLNQESLSEHTLDTYINDCYKKKIDVLWDNNPLVFNSNETYAVIFYKDYDDSVSNLLKFGINALGVVEGVRKILSPTCTDEGGKSGYYTLVVPTSHLGDICEVQAS